MGIWHLESDLELRVLSSSEGSTKVKRKSVKKEKKTLGPLNALQAESDQNRGIVKYISDGHSRLSRK